MIDTVSGAIPTIAASWLPRVARQGLWNTYPLHTAETEDHPTALWSNMAMENGPFINDSLIKTSIYIYIYRGFSIAMFDETRGYRVFHNSRTVLGQFPA